VQYVDYILLIGKSPTFVNHPENRIVFLSDSKSIAFTCEAIEATSYQWKKVDDSMPLDAEGVNSNTLTLKPILAHSGKYHCVATNDIKSSHSNPVTLTVHSEYI